MTRTSFVLPALRVCLIVLAFAGLALPASQARAQGLLEGLNLGDVLTILETAPGAVARDAITPENPVDQAREDAAQPRRQPSRLSATSQEEEGESEEVVPLTPLEQAYSLRAGQQLRQFGYQLFQPPAQTSEQFQPDSRTGLLLDGAIPNDYILGIGDELIITLRGQDARTFKINVDREGRVVLPDLPPIDAAGRPYSEFRAEIERVVRASFIGAEVFVSVGSVRSVSVFVAGEVEKPGLHRLHSLAPVLRAVLLSEGIRPTGSLRKVRLVRGGRSTSLDLYEIALQGNLPPVDMKVLDGDRIIVPPLGKTVAIAGRVKRPGIYELPEGVDSLSLAEAMELAGGALFARGNRFLLRKLDDAGRDIVSEVRDPIDAEVEDGTIVMVQPGNAAEVGVVEVQGHVKVPGRRALTSAPSVVYLVPDRYVLERDPYLLFAVLQRTDPATQTRRFFPLDLRPILARTQDFKLEDQDRLIILGRNDIRYLGSTDVQQVLLGLSAREDLGDPAAQTGDAGPEGENGDENGQAGGTNVAAVIQPRGICDGLLELASLVDSEGTRRFGAAVRTSQSSKRPESLQDETVDEFIVSGDCPDVFRDFPTLLPYLLENVAGLSGEVRQPGLYPIVPGTSFDSVLSLAQGTTREADRTNVELTRPRNDGGRQVLNRTTLNIADAGGVGITMDPGDSVRFNASFTDRESGPVFLIGEFKRPGTYEIRRGETLSQVIFRAGGLTDQSYPFGAVISRPSVQERERENLRRAITDLREALATNALRRSTQAVNVSAAGPVFDSIVENLERQPIIGRVVAEADPTVLQVRPELDTVLEPGDRIVMPKRPNWVAVSGAVLSPGALQFTAGNTADRYVNMAGGFGQNADEDRAFVVFPNGQAQPLALSPWNFAATQIPPGSTIFVPRDAAPFDFFLFAREAATILSQFAVTAASLAVISDN